MNHHLASENDCPRLALWNQQLIQDEGHSNPMNLAQLEQRMRAWLAGGEYRAVIFEQGGESVAYALYRETDTEVYLRQFFVLRHRRREGIGRRTMEALFIQCWPAHKRRTVTVLINNIAALAFWHAMGYSDYSLSLEIRPDVKTLE